jgi:outer membrane protein TolC
MTRTYWKGRILGGLLALVPLGGCRQQLFLEPADYQDALKAGPLAQLESSVSESIVPPTIQPGTAPPTVVDPTRPPRYVTLKECVAIALEQGNIGFPPTTNAGSIQDILPSATGRGTTGTDTIKAYALDPAIASAEIERSLSKFDARWITSMTWQKVDQALAATFQQSLNNGDTAAFSSTLAKPLPTGGTAGITYNMNYRNLASPPTNQAFGALPTSYTPQLQFTFEQPLLQSFGVEINELRTAHPGSQLIPGLQPSGGSGTEGILITRIRLDQQKAEFDREVNNMLFNVETAYWNLFSAYYNLYAQEEGLKQSYDAFLIILNRARGGVARPQAADQYAAQVAQFRAAAVQARGQVLLSERNLRGLLGMRSDDGTRIVPVDDPTLVPYRPDYYELANEAMQYRPELMIMRQELKAQQLNVLLQKNLRRPDLRLLSAYDIQGIGSRLNGDDPNTNALKNFINDNFNSWQVGLRLDMPIGFRDANALVRQAQLNLKKTYFYLTDSERKAMEYLTNQYRSMLEAYELVKYRRAQREALEIYVGKNLQVLNTGAVGQAEFEGFIGNLLQAQQNLATATAGEFQAIAQYNAAIAGVEYAKGTIQRYNNVTVSEGPLPQWVEKKAADHFAARDAGLKLREQPAEVGKPPLTQWQPMQNLPAAPPLGMATGPGSVTPAVTTPPGSALPEPRPVDPTPKAPTPTNPMTDAPKKDPKIAFEAVPTDPSFRAVGTVTLPVRPAAGTPGSGSFTPAVRPTGQPAPVSLPVSTPVPLPPAVPVSVTPPSADGLGAPPLLNTPGPR